MATKKMCAWISRHEPTRAQRASLEGAGYTIRIINPAERVQSAKWVWTLAQNACGGVPAIVVAVMPLNILKDFLQLTSEQTVVVRALMRQTGHGAHDWQWTGRWQRIKRVQMVTEFWEPEGGSR